MFLFIPVNLKLKEVISKFRYLDILGEIDVRDPMPKIFKILKQTGLNSFTKNSQNTQTNRSKLKWNFYIYQVLTVSILKAPKYVISLNIKQIKREPKLSILTLICNLNCPIH